MTSSGVGSNRRCGTRCSRRWSISG